MVYTAKGAKMKPHNLRRKVLRCKGCDLQTDLRLPSQQYASASLLVLTTNPDYESIAEGRPVGGLRRDVWNLLAGESGIGGILTAFSTLVGCHTYGCMPTEEQIAACGWHLSAQIMWFQPSVIVLMADDISLPLQRRLGISAGDFASTPEMGLHYVGPHQMHWIPVVIVPDPATTIEKHHHLGGDLHPEVPLAMWVRGLKRVRELLADSPDLAQGQISERELVTAFERKFTSDPMPRIGEPPESLTKGASTAKESGRARARWRARQLGIPADDREVFRYLFGHAMATDDTGHRVKWDPLQDDWQTSTAPLSLSMVTRHLAGEIVVSSFFSAKAKQVYVACLDVDAHNQYQRALFPETLAKLRQMFPRALVVRSSPSGGAHLYLFFAAPQDAHRLRALLELKLFKADLRHRQVAHGVEVQLTEVLVGPGRGARLPFGYGSWPLVEGFGSDSSVPSMLNYLWEFLGEERNIVRLDDVVGAELRQLRRRGVTAEALLKKLQHKVSGQWQGPGISPRDPHAPIFHGSPDWVKKLYAGGIKTFGTRQRETFSLASHLFRKQLPQPLIEEILEYWFRNRNHWSKDWRRTPNEVLEDLPRLVDAAASAQRGPTRLLPSREDVRFLLDATAGAGRRNRYRLIFLGFNIIRFMLTHGRLEAGLLAPHTYFQRKSSRSRLSPRPRRAAPIHWELLREWGGEHYRQYLEFWKGKLVRWSKSYTPGKRAKKFCLLVEAGTGVPAGDLDQALADLMNDDEIETTFTRLVSNRILERKNVSVD